MARDELRARLLAGAGGVFHRDGIAATGMAALAAELHISKRTVYELFGSKDELVAAALAAHDEPMRATFTAVAEQEDDPLRQLVALFAALEDLVAAPGYRGCPFLNAAAELADHDHPAHAVCRGHKESLRRWIEDAAGRLGVRQPELLSEQLLVLFDGALARATVAPPRPGAVTAAARTLVEGARRPVA